MYLSEETVAVEMGLFVRSKEALQVRHSRLQVWEAWCHLCRPFKGKEKGEGVLRGLV